MYLTSTRIEPATSRSPFSRLIQQTTNSLFFFFFFFFFFPANRKTEFVIPCYVDNLYEMPNLFPWKNEKKCHLLKILPGVLNVKICTNNSHMSVHDKTYKNLYDETDQPAHQ